MSGQIDLTAVSASLGQLLSLSLHLDVTATVTRVADAADDAAPVAFDVRADWGHAMGGLNRRVFVSRVQLAEMSEVEFAAFLCGRTERVFKTRIMEWRTPDVMKVLIVTSPDGGFEVVTDGAAEVIVVSDHTPGDRLYRLGATHIVSAARVADILRDDTIGSSDDERHAALANRIVKAIDGKPHLHLVDAEVTE